MGYFTNENSYFRFDVGLHEAMMSLGVVKLKDEVIYTLVGQPKEVAAMAGVLHFATLLSLIYVGVLSLLAQHRVELFGLMVYLKSIGSVKAEMTCILTGQPVRVPAMSALSFLMCVVAGILSHSYLKTTHAFAVSVPVSIAMLISLSFDEEIWSIGSRIGFHVSKGLPDFKSAFLKWSSKGDAIDFSTVATTYVCYMERNGDLAEIMARYRPIAPRPHTSLNGGASGGSSGGEGDGSPGSGSGSGSSMSPTIRQSPYLRNVWPHLQSRPTRTRKRGRTSLGPPPSTSTTFKRPRTLLQGLSPPFHVTTPQQRTTNLVTLPLLPMSPHDMQQTDVIDLNKVAEIPEEKDFLAQLTKPTSNVISPRPIRLVSSCVAVRAVKDDAVSVHNSPVVTKKAEEVEKELEAQVLPAFVSDSKNKIRLVNLAYKEMVGQPECSWLESMATGDGIGVACKSICGQVVLCFSDADQDSMVSSSGFSCWARIEWGVNGKKNSVNAFGEAMRISCESKDYKFAWRFHTREASEGASNVQSEDSEG
uniref:DUF7950 domain-containing protein n=1 Tax=Tanacetum cinerariifolium TaxID=118510 RepID=A0A6L2NEP6_TANCI|nr:hypothetical protein [Tanacetum cinerariifolium]